MIFAVVVMTTANGNAWAGWLTLRNDTKQELAFQEIKIINGKVVLGKAIKLLPGESVKENKATAGTMTIAIIDPAKPNTIISRGTLDWKKDDIVYAIKNDAATGTTVSVAK